MRIKFDQNIKVAGIGVTPWPRLGLERWLPNYKIISYRGWDVARYPNPLEIIALEDNIPHEVLHKVNTSSIINSEAFDNIARSQLGGYVFLPYKTVDIPQHLGDQKFLMADKTVANKYENKVAFREMFSDKLNFPNYKTYRRSHLSGSLDEFKDIMGGREVIVLQDEYLSGGRGTFFIRNHEEYIKSLENLNRLSRYDRVVVSDVVREAKERTIQAVATGDGVITGPLQRQFVGDPLLANVDSESGDNWCGIQILKSDQNTSIHKQAQYAAAIVGRSLYGQGYRGIFGIDFLLDNNEDLYAIEVNPRVTGATPLLTALFNDDRTAPFYLLHVLELGGYPYSIEEGSASYNKDGALLVFHSLEAEEIVVENGLRSGRYRMGAAGPIRIDESLDLVNIASDEWILQISATKGRKVRPGERVAIAMTGNNLIGEGGERFSPEVKQTIRSIYRAIIH